MKISLTLFLILIIFNSFCNGFNYKQYEQGSKCEENDICDNFYFNVLDYGAQGDGKFDNTQSFVKTMQAAFGKGGGIVIVPPGKYLFSGNINIPTGVSLQGSYSSVPSHKGQQSIDSYEGSCLLPTAGKNNPGGIPFITLSRISGIKGFVIFYIDQDPNPSSAPTPYPYTLFMKGESTSIQDIELVNSYQGIQVVSSDNFYISRVQGQPILIGINIDGIQKAGRVENVHFYLSWSTNIRVTTFQLTQGRGIVVGKSDSQYIFNTFIQGYSIAFHFIKSDSGLSSGNLMSVGTDSISIASVMVNQSLPEGVSITNGQFSTSVNSSLCDQCSNFEPTHVIIDSLSQGSVRFTNSAFKGQANRIANGAGTVDSMLQFQNCIFYEWKSAASYAIVVRGGNLILINNEFRMQGQQVDIQKGTAKAIVKENFIKGKQQIQCDQSVKNIIAQNLDE